MPTASNTRIQAAPYPTITVSCLHYYFCRCCYHYQAMAGRRGCGPCAAAEHHPGPASHAAALQCVLPRQAAQTAQQMWWAAMLDALPTACAGRTQAAAAVVGVAQWSGERENRHNYVDTHMHAYSNSHNSRNSSTHTLQHCLASMRRRPCRTAVALPQH